MSVDLSVLAVLQLLFTFDGTGFGDVFFAVNDDPWFFSSGVSFVGVVVLYDTPKRVVGESNVKRSVDQTLNDVNVEHIDAVGSHRHQKRA